MPAPYALIVEDLHKSFGSVTVLNGITLQIKQGEVISLIGSSGSGKSTLLRCINLLEIPDAGEVTIGDEKIRMKKNRHGELVPADTKQVDRVRTRLGMVFQHFNLWSHMTILQNVMEAPLHVLKQPREEVAQRAMNYLDKVGIADKAQAFPYQLSGGQQQRAAIARALTMEPDLLMFDEPTSALDPELVGEVLQVMRRLADEGRSMIVATHEMGFARDVSSRVIFLNAGRIEAEGPPDEVFTNPKSERCRQFLSGYLSGPA
jgi:octopine/nopaline transport system ATP-binding protein